MVFLARNQRRSTIAMVSMLVACLFATSCRQLGAFGPYEEREELSRDPSKAAELCKEAVPLMDAEPERAEALLREALTADLYHGPAHNNLGVLYLKQDKLYEAANEFEWARKLMPGHPDPRLNLALTLERAGRFDEALQTYNAGLEVYSEHIPTLQAIARLTLRMGHEDERLPQMLSDIALRGETEEWRSWAQQRMRERIP